MSKESIYVNNTVNETIKKDAKLLLDAAFFSEAILIMENLMGFGNIHTVKNVIGESGSHAETIKRADEWLKQARNRRNWTEDFTHENGNYMNTCVYCKNEFKGHKRRVICKICNNDSTV